MSPCPPQPIRQSRKPGKRSTPAKRTRRNNLLPVYSKLQGSAALGPEQNSSLADGDCRSSHTDRPVRLQPASCRRSTRLSRIRVSRRSPAARQKLRRRLPPPRRRPLPFPRVAFGNSLQPYLGRPGDEGGNTGPRHNWRERWVGGDPNEDAIG